jgi:uncharacterized membrane protein
MFTIGRRVYGLGAVVLGVAQMRFGAVSADWLPVPARSPGDPILVYGSALVLVLGGVAINLRRLAAIAALTLAGLFVSGMVVFLLPHSLTKPASWGGWQGVAESTAMALGGVLGYGQAAALRHMRAVRLGFGMCLLVFGISHFVYARFTASLVPAWLPPSRLSWAYATGVAQIAAGLAMLSGVQARLAAILLTVMYAGFGLLVHLPSIIANPSSQDDWTENGINLILLGAAWGLADSLARRKSPS